MQALDNGLGDAPLERGAASLDALGRAVVAGLNAQDHDALLALAITEREYKRRLFNALSNSESARQMGPALLWSMQSGESRDDLRHILELHGGKNLSFVAIEPRATEARDGITLHRRPVLVVHSADERANQRLFLLGSVVEHDATHTFKLIAYRYRDRDE